MNRCTIYQAGPLFSEAEREWHCKLATALQATGHTVVWPGSLMTAADIKSTADPAKLIFHTCRDAIDHCACVVAMLDGSPIDDGTAWEIGYAHAKGVPVYGIRTDFRNSGETPGAKINAMIDGCLSGLAKDIDELVAFVL
ncbi:MAG: nucleoside 2-deoxyribosyltransferase [Deltaproteobacteria bacterium]|nr:nucleoside 2-deoxyribosyltransferase [Deltaproteobacteria bacterium]